MALVYKDRVKETSTTTGTGTYTLAGAVSGFQSFSAIGNGNTVYYAATMGADWEVGLGTWATGGTLARTSVLASTNSNNAVSWGAGTKTIWGDVPATVFANLYSNPITTRGDLVTGGVAGVAQRLAVGGAGQILGSDGTDPGYIAPWYGLAGGRLTLTSGTAVTTSDVTGATSIYYTPHIHDQIGLYDGTRWKVYTFTERTLALGTLTSDLPYDVFLYDNAGTLTLESLAWTNGTTRATAITQQNGVWCKSGALTRRYLGTFYTTSTTQTEDSAAKRLVWNVNNRCSRRMKVVESTDLWTYSTASYRPMNNSTANRLQMVRGLDEDSVTAFCMSLWANDSTGFAVGGIGLDSTSSSSADLRNLHVSGVIYSTHGDMVPYVGAPGLGFHFLQALEYAQATGTTTWFGDAGASATYQAGIVGEVMA